MWTLNLTHSPALSVFGSAAFTGRLPINSHTIQDMPTNMNRYMLRGIELDLVCGEAFAFTYAKLGPFALFGIVEPFEPRLEGTKIHVREGTIGPTRYVLPHVIWEYWKDRAKKHAEVSCRFSTHQQAKIDDEIDANLERLAQSGTFEAMRYDVELFGTDLLRKRS